MGSKEAGTLSREELTEKAKHYCAYQERSRLQVLRKLKTLGCYGEDAIEILEILIEGNYLNEQRFVEQYVRSRSAVKGWGPRKISMALNRETGENKEVEPDENAARLALLKLKKDLLKKQETLRTKSDPKEREKLLAFCYSRGFDFETAAKIVNNIENG